ncbi:MFS general substrate transporter [Pleurotus eryngii]|uniref:MFS general substrate transporter n=1 Tax=Pleurotus eryngii TaxID=5323 RepID=A0A9P6A4I8_PLEER|nr:MFS general substrate transporter [Pleurotus eryngii]
MPVATTATDYKNGPDDAHTNAGASERTPLLLRPSSSKSTSSSSSSKCHYSIKTCSPSSSSPSCRCSARSPTSPTSNLRSSPSTARSPTSSSLRSPPQLQWSQIYIILLLQLCEPLTSQSIYPYINQLIRDLGVTGGDEQKVGFYAGLVESLFFLTEALTVLHWSRVSDRVGRKPVLLVGLMGLGVSTLGFGMARTFAGIVISRCICGMLNGNIGVMKSVMGELTTPANRAQGFALMPVVWSAGATLGPLIGGGLSKPYDRFPPSLSFFHTEFWREHPYFLPCAAVALFVGVAWVVTAVFFRENGSGSSHTQQQRTRNTDRSGGRTPLASLLTRRTLVPVANYTLLALLSISINALQPLFFAEGPDLGIPGLALPPPTIGLILGAFGVLNGLFQALFFPAIVKRWGAKGVFRAGVGAAGASGVGGFGEGIGGGGGGEGFGWMVWALVGVQLALCVLVDMAYGCIFMFITASAPAHALGATNGLAQTAVSVARAIGPVVASSLFSVSLGWRYKYEYEHQQRHHRQCPTQGHSDHPYEGRGGGGNGGTGDWVWGMVGANMVYIFVVALSGVAVWVGGMLPDTLDESPDESDGEDRACGGSRDGEGECGEEACGGVI